MTLSTHKLIWIRHFAISALFTFISLLSSAQQRVDVIDSGSKSDGSGYTTKEVNGEMRASALVVIQSTAKLNYSVMGVTITNEEMKRSVDSDGIYTDTLYFYVNDFDSRRKLMLFAQGFPSETIDLNMKPNTTYSYMVIAPNNGADVVEEVVESYESLMLQGKMAVDNEQFEYAEKIFDRALQIKESDEVFAYIALSQYRQANTLNKKHFYPTTIENSKKAIALNSENYIANVVCGAATVYRTSYKYKLGKSTAEKKRIRNDGCESAIAHLQAALTYSKSHDIAMGSYGLDLYYELGQAYYLYGDYPLAEAYLGEVTEFKRSAASNTIANMKRYNIKNIETHNINVKRAKEQLGFK